MNIICSPSAYLILYIALMAAHIGLVWWLPYFPTQDGPSHLYNLVVLHDLLNGGKEWGQYFSYQLQAIPNFGFEAISYPLLKVFPILAVEKIFISLYIILLGVSVPVFLKTFGRTPFPLAFLILPLIFNFTLMMGFYSYVIAIPLFLIFASLAWKTRNRSPLRKLIIFNISGVMLFYFHLIPFIYYIMFLVIMTLVETTNFRNSFIRIAKLLIIISPSLVNLFLYFGAVKEQAPASKVLRVTFDYLLKDLYFFSTVTFAPLQIVPAYLFMTLIIIGVYMSLKDFILNGCRFTDNSTGNKSLLIFGSLLLLIYFVMPFRFGGGSYFNERLPWFILLTLLPLLFLSETKKRKNLISFAGIIISIISFSCNTIIFSHQSKVVSEYLSGLQLELTRSAFGMGYKTRDNEWSRIDVLAHAASYYGIFKGTVDIGDYEAGLPYFPVQFKKTIPPMPPSKQIEFAPTTIQWYLYPSIRYLFGWDLNSVEKIKLAAEFHIIREEGRLTIWERNSGPQ